MGAITYKSSVALATFNGEQYIRKQLQSLYEQSEQPYEVIISDDGSKDSTIDIVRNFINEHNLENWKLLQNNGEHGVGNNFLNAMKHCTGDIVFLCDQDDIWLTDKIKSMVCLFGKGYSCVISSMEYIDADDKRLPISTAFTCKKDHVVTLNELLAVCSYLGMTAAFKRTVFENVDFTLWNETSHDWALFVEALHEGNILFYGKCLQYHRMHAENASGISGESAAEKRINLLNRQVQHITPIKQLHWVSVEQKSTCDEYIQFINNRIGWIKRHKPLSIVLNIGQYHARNYTSRNMLADMKNAL